MFAVLSVSLNDGSVDVVLLLQHANQFNFKQLDPPRLTSCEPANSFAKVLDGRKQPIHLADSPFRLTLKSGQPLPYEPYSPHLDGFFVGTNPGIRSGFRPFDFSTGIEPVFKRMGGREQRA